MPDIFEIIQRRVKSPEGLSKSLEELERAAIEFYEGGATQKTIAELYGISQSYVSKILKRHNVTIRTNKPTTDIPRNDTKNKQSVLKRGL